MKTLNIIASILLLSILFYSCDKNEDIPEIADQEFFIAENSEAGALVGTVVATDEGQNMSFEIIEGNLDGYFLIDSKSGAITLSDLAEIDYEGTTEFSFKVSVNDNHEKEPLESAAVIKINVTDENESAPVIEDQTIYLKEMPAIGTQIAVLEASDEDIHQKLYYEIFSSNRTGFLEIDSVSGAITVKDPEALYQLGNNDIYFRILVKDDHTESLSDTALVELLFIDLKDQMVLYLPMTGDAIDQSSNNTSTIVDGPILASDRFGNPDQAYQFDGLDDSINLNNNLPLITSRYFTISLWAKFEGRSQSDLGSNVFFEQLDDNTTSDLSETTLLFEGESQDYLGFSLESDRSGQVYKVSTDAENDGEWHHYVVCLDELARMRVYIDGRIRGQSHFMNPGDFVKKVDHVNLGAYHFGGEIHGAFNGIMDEVLIFNRTLKDFEISALFNDVLKE